MESPDPTTPPKRVLTLDDFAIKARDGSILFRPTLAQVPYLTASDPNVFFYGNRGGGKSFCARWHAHSMALRYPGLKYFVVRRHYGDLQKTHLADLPIELEKFGGEKHGFSWNKNEHIARYANGSMGFYAQCDSEDDTRKVLGAEAGLIVFDESPELQWEWLMLMAASARVPKSLGITPMVRYLGNPFGPSINDHWRYFIDKDVEPEDEFSYVPNDWRAIRIDLDDNPHVDAEATRKRYASVVNPLQRKAWLLGERTVEGQLFDFRPTVRVANADGSVEVRSYHVIDELPTLSDGRSVLEEPWVRIFRAYDHGYIDPAVCLWFAVIGKQVICFHECSWTRTPADEVARDILRQTQALGIKRVTATYCDPSIDLNDGSVVSIKDSMERQHLVTPDGKRIGLPMDCARNDRELFADVIHRFLQDEVGPGTPRIQFLSGKNRAGPRGCPDLIKALPQMMHDPKNPLRIADHKRDHWPITLAYFLMSHIPTTKPQEQKSRNPYLPVPSRRVLGSESVRRR